MVYSHGTFKPWPGAIKTSTDRKRAGSEHAGHITRTISLYSGHSHRKRANDSVPAFCL